MTPSRIWSETRSLDTERASGLFGLGYAAIWNNGKLQTRVRSRPARAGRIYPVQSVDVGDALEVLLISI